MQVDCATAPGSMQADCMKETRFNITRYGKRYGATHWLQRAGERTAQEPFGADRHDHPDARDNRFFSEMSRAFEGLARKRHWYPIVMSTLRDPALELETDSTLISYRIEYLVVTGATDPDSVSQACRNHGIAHVNVELPGTTAASVISDNYWDAQRFTLALIERSSRLSRTEPPVLYRWPRRHIINGNARWPCSRFSNKPRGRWRDRDGPARPFRWHPAAAPAYLRPAQLLQAASQARARGPDA
jgi:hypothetical protein